MKESEFQSKLIKELKQLFPGCIVMKNDADYIQGIPDLTVLYKDKWAVLECKVSESAVHQANQDFYISRMSEMSYASFIFPENKTRVLYELKALFRSH